MVGGRTSCQTNLDAEGRVVCLTNERNPGLLEGVESEGKVVKDSTGTLNYDHTGSCKSNKGQYSITVSKSLKSF